MGPLALPPPSTPAAVARVRDAVVASLSGVRSRDPAQLDDAAGDHALALAMGGPRRRWKSRALRLIRIACAGFCAALVVDAVVDAVVGEARIVVNAAVDLATGTHAVRGDGAHRPGAHRAGALGVFGDVDGAQRPGAHDGRQAVSVLERARGVARALERYRIERGAYPSEPRGLQDLVEPVRGRAVVGDIRMLEDPWGHGFVYSLGHGGAESVARHRVAPHAAPYELLSRGADGVLGTDDDVAFVGGAR